MKRKMRLGLVCVAVAALVAFGIGAANSASAQCVGCGDDVGYAGPGCDSCGPLVNGTCRRTPCCPLLAPISWIVHLLGGTCHCNGCGKEVYYGDDWCNCGDCCEPCDRYSGRWIGGPYPAARGYYDGGYPAAAPAPGGCGCSGGG